jgi:leucine dehydrogenase
VLEMPEKSKRKAMIRRYIEYVNMLGGKFITGADLGVTANDLSYMAELSPYIVGVRGDPVADTIAGIIEALPVALEYALGTKDINKRSFAVQGLGKTGHGLVTHLHKQKASKIYISDINQKQVRLVTKRFRNVIPVHHSDIISQNVDVFCPCALSHAINEKSINRLRCKLIIGSANNQLENDHIGRMLHEMGVVYAPDFVVNAGGLISVIDEHENKRFSSTRVTKKRNNIGKTLGRVLEIARKTSKSTDSVAREMANKRIQTQGV